MATPAPPSLTIIVVDDHPVDVQLIRWVLDAHELPYELRVMDHGDQAIEVVEHLAQQQPLRSSTIMLLDLHFPQRDGKDILRQLSLSRLNHWLPRAQAHPKVVQGTAQFHDQSADARLPQADPVFDDATALHTTVDMLDPEPAVVQHLIDPLLLPCQLLAPWLLGRHKDLHLRKRERQKAAILQQPTSRRQGVRRRVGNRLVMDAASTRVTEKEDNEQGID